MNLRLLITLTLILIVYGYNINTHVGFGDALGFVWGSECCFQLGTNATCHFAYINFLRIVVLFLPAIDAFCIASVVSVVSSIICLYFMYKTVSLITNSVWSPIFAMVGFAFSFTFWRQTEIVEVYTFNLAFVACFMYLSARILLKKSSANIIVLASILLGFLLWIHIKNVLLYPAFVFVCYCHNPRISRMIISMLPSLLIGVFLFVLPLFTLENSLKSVLFENDFFLTRAIDHDTIYFITSFIKNVGYLVYNLHVFLIFGIWGIIKLFQKLPKLVIFIFLVGVPYFAFPVFYDVPDNYVFALVFYLTIMICAGVGFDVFINYAFIKKINYLFLVLSFSISPLIYFLCWKTAEYMPQFERIEKLKAYKGGMKYLLWPGMKNNISLIELSKKLKKSKQYPSNFDEFKWNYDLAINYLEWKKNKENL